MRQTASEFALIVSSSSNNDEEDEEEEDEGDRYGTTMRGEGQREEKVVCSCVPLLSCGPCSQRSLHGPSGAVNFGLTAFPYPSKIVGSFLGVVTLLVASPLLYLSGLLSSREPMPGVDPNIAAFRNGCKMKNDEMKEMRCEEEFWLFLSLLLSTLMLI